MAIVWQNSFDGTPGTEVTVANSGQHGDPIAGLRNDPPANAVRYGNRAVAGASSMQLGTPAGTPHGDVWLYYPGGDEYSISFYMYLPEGGWFRVRDTNVVTEFYIATGSQSYIGDAHPVPDEVRDAVFDRWTRVEISTISTRTEYRMWWTDPQSTGTPDYTYDHGRDGGTIDGIFTQGAGDSGSTTPYLDQVRIGQGEWLGPWPTHHTTSASASLTLSAPPVDSTADHHQDGHTTASSVLPLTAPPVGSRRHARVSAHGNISLWGTASSTRHTRTGASADIGTLAAEDVETTRGGTTSASASLELFAPPVASSTRHRPSFPPLLTTEILLGGEWVDITADVRTSEPVHITRGRADEAATADPSAMSLLLNNRHGRYSPRNPLSPYYGHLGRNTPIRVRCGPLPEPGLLQMEDSFDRTVADGWGTADTGQTWVSLSAPNTTVNWVDDGAGHVQLHSLDDLQTFATEQDLPADLDLTWDVSADRVPTGTTAAGALYLSVGLRRGSDESHLRVHTGLRVDIGGGIRVSAELDVVHDGTSTALTPTGYPIPGLVYTPGAWLHVRAQAIGGVVRTRVWAEGTPEPEVWHAQAYETSVTGPGRITTRVGLTTGADTTTLPVTTAYRNITYRSLPEPATTVRFTGQVVAWPSRWDVSDSEVHVPVEAAGVLRRLGQGASPLRSPLRRTVAGYLPVAYWPLEDGSETRHATSAVDGVGPLRTTGMRFGQDDSLVPSRALPTLGSSASMVSPQIGAPAASASSWEVLALIHLDTWPPDDLDTEQELLTVHTTTGQVRLSLDRSPSGVARMRIRIYNNSGNEIESSFLDEDVDWSTAPLAGGWRMLVLTMTQVSSSTASRQSGWRDSEENGAEGFAEYSGQIGRPTHIDTAFGAELDGMAIGHLSVWSASRISAYYRAFQGFAGETAHQRMARVAMETGIPLELEGTAAERLGMQQDGTFLDVITHAQEADLGSPGEDREELGLTYRGRDVMYNQPVALTLDYAGGHISPPMEPEDDDQALRNDVEVTRIDGASAQVEDLDGPLGVETVGRYDESVQVNLASDLQADAQAGWRLHLGTVDELRWPTIHLDLANPRVRPLIEDIISLDAGDRVRILHPPYWTQNEHLDLIVQGYEENIGLFQWDVTLTCTPASPWVVAEVADETAAPDVPVRADTAGSELAAPAREDATSVMVSTTTGPTWVTTADDPDSFPFDITVGGEIMRVTNVGSPGPAGQAFTVVRAINRVTKPHPAKTKVRLAYPAVVAL